MLFDSVMQPAEADAVPGLPGMFVLIKDQHGPRIIQKKMKLDSSEQKQALIKNIPSEGQLQIVPELYGLVIPARKAGQVRPVRTRFARQSLRVSKLAAGKDGASSTSGHPPGRHQKFQAGRDHR
uniref:(northern house mosquito) hypothetical protein n=1 Tax=Culex pipiens TaxID=7175 RepID=A0A8D8MJ70_CULPI